MACNTQSLKSGLTVLRCFQVLINLLFTGASAFAVFFVGKAYSDSSKSGNWTNRSALSTAQALAQDNLTKGLVAVTVICALCLISYIFVLVLLVYTAVPRTRAHARCCGNNRPYATYTTNLIFDIFLAVFWGAMLALMITGYNKLEWIQWSVSGLPEEGPWTAKGLHGKGFNAPALPSYSGYSSDTGSDSSDSSSPSQPSHSGSSTSPYSSDYSTYSTSPYSSDYSSYSSSPSSPSYSSRSYMSSPSPSPFVSQVQDMPHVGRQQVVSAVASVGSQVFIAAIAASAAMVLLFLVTTALDIAMRSALCTAAATASVKAADEETGTVPPQQQYSQPPPQCFAKDGSKTTAAAAGDAFRHPAAYTGAYSYRRLGDQFA